MADTLSDLTASTQTAFATLMTNVCSQVSEVKSLAVLRGAGSVGQADLKALHQRLVSAEASITELSAFVQGEEENLEALQVLASLSALILPLMETRVTWTLGSVWFRRRNL